MIRARASTVLGALSVVTGLMGQACVLPDLDIVTEDEKITNKQAVRFAPSALLSAHADAACIQRDPELDEGCPQPATDPSDVLPSFLDPRYRAPDNTLPYDFCTCDPGERDDKALPPFILYVEDRDEDARTRTPKDSIYAALLLDVDPKDDEPYLKVRYSSYLDTDRPLEPADTEYEPLLRPPPHLRQLSLGDETQRVDLCNRAGGDALAPGYHTLRIIVSDRPWFQRTDSNGQKVTQTGVPNLAIGATFDIATYVFHCDEKREDDKSTTYNEAHCVSQCISDDEEDL